MLSTIMPWIPLFASLVTALSAGIAAFAYKQSVRTKRAEFLLQLHQSFFVDATYRKMRDLLDDPGPTLEAKAERAIADETADLTDFLNFFELVAYFRSRGTLTHTDVQALLGYYLDILRRNPKLSAYIRNEQKSFEYLSKTLAAPR